MDFESGRELELLPSKRVVEAEVVGDSRCDAGAPGDAALLERMRKLRKATPRSEHLETLTSDMLKDALADRENCDD